MQIEFRIRTTEVIGFHSIKRMHLEKFEAVKDKTAILYLYIGGIVSKLESMANTLVFFVRNYYYLHSE